MNNISRLAIWIIIIMSVHTCLRVCEANADVEIVGGGLTYHLLDGGTANRFHHKLSSDGRLISNPMVGISVTDHYFMLFKSLTAFTGQNSVGGPILGGLYEEGFEINHLEIGVGVGTYSQESHNFTDVGINSTRLVNIQGMDIVPLAGIVLNYKINLDNYFIKVNNLISPIITNTTLSVGYSY